MATFAYGRVSTKEQTTDNQRLEIERAGFKPDYWYMDEGVSGGIAACLRPQFSKLLGQIRDGETLVVSKLDRLGRDAFDVGAVIRSLQSRQIAIIVIQLGRLDLTSPAGKLMLTMLAAVGEMERDLLIERTQAGLSRAKAEGKLLGRPPKTNGEQRLDIVESYKQGTSISALARRYKISRATVSRIAKLPAT